MAAPSTSFNDHTYNVISHTPLLITLKNVSAKSWGDEKVPQSPGPLTRTITPVLTRIYSNWLGVVKPEYTCRQRTMMENSSQKGLSPWRERPISCGHKTSQRSRSASETVGEFGEFGLPNQYPFRTRTTYGRGVLQWWRQ